MNELVALALPYCNPWKRHIEAIWDAGNAFTPIDSSMPEPARQRLLDVLQPTKLLDDNGIHNLAGGRSIEPGDAVVIATSGTTGAPKGVVLTHYALAASTGLAHDALGVTSGDKWLACLPLSHIGGLSVVTRAIIDGLDVEILPRFDTRQVEEAGQNGYSITSLVATTLDHLDTSLFRKILLGGGPAPRNRPANAITTYGMTETAGGVVYDGCALPGVQIRIADDDTIEIKSPTLLRCYRDATPILDGQPIDGWLRTGDAGRIDPDGRLHVIGRKDDVIISGGEKIWPQAVEAVIERHPNVNAVVVSGSDDERWGRRVVAVIESTEPLSLDELREWVKNELPAYCAPKELRVVERLPRTSTGKLKRSSE